MLLRLTKWCTAGFAILMFSRSICAQVVFAPRTDYPTGDHPLNLITADFNGDGKLDLAVTNFGSGSVSILLGKGDGTFGPKTDYPTGGGAHTVATGDINGDGILDLAISNSLVDTVSILLGNGDGTFVVKPPFASSSAPCPNTPTATCEPIPLVLADLNRDGKLDLAVLNQRGRTISIFLGDGHGSFTLGQEVSFSGDLHALAKADLNADGKPDLVVGRDPSLVSVLLGNGDGTVTLTGDFPVGNGPSVLTTADFNHDGNVDVAVQNADLISILLGNGDGTLGPKKDVAASGHGVGPGVTSADLNGDGQLDLITANFLPSGNVSIFLGNGDGTFGTNTDFPVTSSTLFPVAGDFDGDGKPDIANTNFFSNSVSVMLNRTTPSVTGAAGGPTNQQATTGEPISSGNGNYYYQHADMVFPGRGMPVAFQRTYNSLDSYSGPLGANWTHSYNTITTETPTGTIIKWGDGHVENFTFTGLSYISQPGVFSTLTKNADGMFVLTRKDQTQFLFSRTGRLASIQDKNGNSVVLTYDGSGNLSRISDTVGRNLSLSYDASNRVMRITDPIGRNILFQYDVSNNLVQATDDAGGVTTFAYDLKHRVISIVQPNGQTLLTNTYDASGRVVSQTGGRNFAATLAYNTPNPGDTTITDPRGNATVHSYDASLRIARITDALGRTIDFTYDSNNDRTSVTNQNGKTTNFAYDGRGNVTGIADPLAHTVSFTYDARNNLLTAMNAKGKTTTFAYDVNGNLTTIRDALGNTTSFTHDSFGELISKSDARGNATAFSYDVSGNLTRITDALGHSTNLSYDGVGRLISITDPNGHAATATYDALSRLVRITDPLGNQTKFAYDAVGNLLKITDAKANATSYAYDATNNLVSVTDALGHITRYAYDANNNRITFTNAKGNATGYTYDMLNRLNKITDPLSLATSYFYDPVGNVLAVTDAKGQTNQFSYDALNRLLAIFYAEGKKISYSYDANGNRINMGDSHGTTAYSYDDLDRLTSITHPGGKTVAYVHDAVGNRSSLTYPDGKAVNYAYDATNRLSGVADWLGRTTTYNYDPASNLIGTTYPNRASLAFVYDTANRLTQVRNNYKGSADSPLNPITSFTYALDAIGNRLRVTDGSGKVTSYAYDNLNELVSVTSGTNVTSFAYDAVGNRIKLTAPGTSINYTYDAADRLLMAGTSAFTYDANGNEISKTQTATGQPIVYSYDSANRLVRATGGAVTSAFAYDGDGNRITQSVGTGTYNYLNDVATALPVVLQESGPDGFLSYAYGLGLVSESSSTFDAFYQYDGLGSVVGLTDPSGKLLGRYAYDAWGHTDLTAPGPQLGTKNKFRFTGEALDPATQLYYLRARYYDPSVGRFLQRDPLRGSAAFPLVENGLIYALNNPVSLIDPTGLSAQPFSDLQIFFSSLSSELARNTVKYFGKQFGSYLINLGLTRGDLQLGTLSADIYGIGSTIKTGLGVLTIAGLGTKFVTDITTNWNKPNMDWTEKLARTSLNLGVRSIDAAFGIACTSVTAGVGVAACITIQSTFNAAYDKNADRIFNALQTTETNVINSVFYKLEGF